MLEKIKPYINYIGLALLAILFILLCRGYLHHDGAGTHEVRNQLEQIGTNQQNIGAGITESTKQTQNIRKEVGDTRGRIEYITEQEQSAGDIIADCKQIIRTIKARGKTDTH